MKEEKIVRNHISKNMIDTTNLKLEEKYIIFMFIFQRELLYD